MKFFKYVLNININGNDAERSIDLRYGIVLPIGSCDITIESGISNFKQGTSTRYNHDSCCRMHGDVVQEHGAVYLDNGRGFS